MLNSPDRAYPKITDIDGYLALVERIRSYDDGIAQHTPEYGERSFPKALDLGYLAVYYSGGVPWSVRSETGGMSVATSIWTAQGYQRNAMSPNLWEPARDRCPGFVVPRSRILSIVSPSVGSLPIDPYHPSHENNEKILTSVHLSDFDSRTEELIRTIFEEHGNPQYIEQSEQ